MVASHTEKPLGFSKWLERPNHTPGTLPLGKGQGLLMSPTQGQANINGGNPRTSHFAVPKGTAVWLATIV